MDILLAAFVIPVMMTGGAAQAADPDYGVVDRMIDENLFGDLSRFVAIKTYRDASRPEATVVAGLEKLRDDLKRQAQEFNLRQTTGKLRYFEWKQPVPGESGRDYWLFGLRLGNGNRRVAVITHLDTVPPGTKPGWTPFSLKRESRSYNGRADQEFYVGRGSIDDKGPAIVAFNVLKALAKRYDGSPKLKDLTVEVLFDTSEETDMALPHFLKAVPDERPDFGLIYDAFWCVRAEKGIERPVFTIESAKRSGPGDLWVESLDTPQGPANQIADTATATIRSATRPPLVTFAGSVGELYRKFKFDDPAYRAAKLTIDRSDLSRNRVRLVTDVAGAQHGSAPEENREEGANPLVSLANFLAHLADRRILQVNAVTRMSRFVESTWGTRVFGEHHPKLLERHDAVFGKGNGTSYAVTRFYTRPSPGAGNDMAVRLEMDIRYAIGHHSATWDGRSEGFLHGAKSIFGTTVLPALIAKFNAGSDFKVSFATQTIAPPDIRIPGQGNFAKVNAAYSSVTGKQCPAYAIGGGTDAKGDTRLIAAGALFTNRMGPPVNYHGFNEAAPVEDLKRGARIIFRLLANEVETAGLGSPAPSQ